MTWIYMSIYIYWRLVFRFALFASSIFRRCSSILYLVISRAAKCFLYSFYLKLWLCSITLLSSYDEVFELSLIKFFCESIRLFTVSQKVFYFDFRFLKFWVLQSAMCFSYWSWWSWALLIVKSNFGCFWPSFCVRIDPPTKTVHQGLGCHSLFAHDTYWFNF